MIMDIRVNEIIRAVYQVKRFMAVSRMFNSGKGIESYLKGKQIFFFFLSKIVERKFILLYKKQSVLS